jgi:arylsulfatase
LAIVKWKGEDALERGKHVLEFDWKYDGPGLGKGGVGTLKANGQVLDSHPMPRSLPVGVGWCETFCVGVDTGTAWMRATITYHSGSPASFAS